ncbi:MAG TPA: OmpA family protein [Ferruginibacter sp.]|nr:OmpA family protein [Ferruginibacter sp.]HRQ19771.1 OmpA family protein [Ferruginibacter sp.]
MKKSLLMLALVFGGLSLHAQVNYEYVKAADQYYAKGDYYSAARWYEKALGKGKVKARTSGGFSPYGANRAAAPKQKVAVSDKEQAMFNLAESYRKLHFHEKALPYYQDAVKTERFPLARYHYATTLRAMQQNEAAEGMFNEFLNSYTENDPIRESAQRELASLQYQKVQTDAVDMSQYKVTKVTGLADTGGLYAPVWIDNTVYYTSSKPEEGAPKLQVNNNRLYQATYTNGTFSAPAKVGLPEMNDVHQGAITFSPDGSKAIFNRWTIGNGTKSSSLYISKMQDGKWLNPVALPEAINMPGYNAQQAFWMNDGKTILFSSDMPGGFGGFDLWMTTLDELDNATPPVNMGPGINTANDDQAPYYHVPSQSLVYSSNGRVGMGGMDLYYVKGTPGGAWGEVKNFGAPLNSNKDDIYFASQGKASNILEDVLFSSDRDASCCLEIFALQRTILPKTISGIVVHCETKEPLPGATVSLINPSNNQTMGTQKAGMDGSYSFTIDDFMPLKAVASNEGYVTNELRIAEPANLSMLKLMNPDICLDPIVVEKPVVVNNVYYDYDKSELRPESYPELDKLVAMFEANPNIKVEISAHTDSKGSNKYNQRLSDARAKSVVDYLISKGVKRENLTSKGYGATQPVADNTNEDGSDNPEGRQLNRRTEFKVVSQ